jgi:outer membrane autotransporter protein
MIRLLLLSSFALGTGYILANKRGVINELEYSYKAEHEFTPFIGNYTSTEIIDDEDPDYGSGANNSHGLKIKNTTQTLILNSYFDFVNSSKFTPYVNLGLGVARHKTSADFYDDIMSSKSINNFAWSIGAGVAYNINDSLALDLGYKYSNLGDIKVKTNAYYEYYDDIDDYDVESEKSSNFKFENRSHDLTVGLRYTF